MFYYVKNLQGDIVKILDEDGQEKANYVYNAWGDILSQSEDELSSINPLRNRGYVYDEDTAMYYLQTRYYDPKTGRFINADATAYVDTNSGTPLSTNMSAYCENNHINDVDPDGENSVPFVNMSLANALSGIMISISASLISIKAALSSCWLPILCISAVVVAIVGIVYTVNKIRCLMSSAKNVISSVKTKIILVV